MHIVSLGLNELSHKKFLRQIIYHSLDYNFLMCYGNLIQAPWQHHNNLALHHSSCCRIHYNTGNNLAMTNGNIMHRQQISQLNMENDSQALNCKDYYTYTHTLLLSVKVFQPDSCPMPVVCGDISVSPAHPVTMTKMLIPETGHTHPRAHIPTGLFIYHNEKQDSTEIH